MQPQDETAVTIDGWILSASPGTQSLSPVKPPKRRTVPAGPIHISTDQLLTKNYVRVTGALHGNVLLLKSWQPVSEPQPFVIAEWERLRDKATAHLEKHAMTFAPEADTVRAHEFAFALLRHESVTNVVAVDTPRGRLFIVASPDPSSAEAEINDHGLTDHVLVLEARWSADAVEQADEVLSGLPDDENVMISGGISSHGEPIHEIVLLRRNDHFTRLTELFPAEQVAVRAWIHPA